MTTKKPREWTVMVDAQNGLIRPAAMLLDGETVHVREVLPEPTDREIEKMFWVHENTNGVPHTKRDDPAWMYSQKDFEAGFRAALDWMKGKK